MFEGLLGRLVGGALWGLGAGVALNLARAGGPGGIRPAAKSLMKAYVAISERVQETTAEARESLEDLLAEAQAERDVARPTGRGASPGPEGAASATPAS